MSQTEFYPFVIKQNYRFSWEVPELNDPKLGCPQPCKNGWDCSFRSKDGRPCNKVHQGEEGCSRRIFKADSEHKFDCVRMTGCPFHNHAAHYYDRMMKNMTYNEYKKFKKWTEFRAPRSGFCTYYADEELKAQKALEEEKALEAKQAEKGVAIVHRISPKERDEQFISSLTEEIQSIFQDDNVKSAMVSKGYSNLSAETIAKTMYKNLLSWQIVQMAKDDEFFIQQIQSTCDYLSKLTNVCM